MLCPLDQTELRITEREKVEIDYCPTCRGVWLDRGELDKIIERFAADRSTRAAASDQRPDRGPGDGAYGRPADDDEARRRYAAQRGYRYDDDDDDDDDRYRGRRRRNWLEDLFDF
ncbi:MAG TPA: zf-TFIIB domain-containing protein [Mycobacterium sp.]|nr:zf-TFIIB domain-containing protein [Mycobacterium sp.]